MPTLRLKIPPPVVTLATALSMGSVARATPAWTFAFPGHRILAGGLALAGVLVALVGVASFRRARTAVNPLKPERASSLVVTGIYRRTRNPMYLGMLLALVGWAAFLANPVACLFLPAFILYMNRFQIRPEEAALLSRFGPEFTAYRSRVRRWL